MASESSCGSDTESSSPPKFDFSSWNPEPPAGISFISLLPLHQGYDISSDLERDDAPGKSKSSVLHRKTRRMEFTAGRTVGRDLRDERRLKHAVEMGDTAQAAILLQDGVDPSCHDDKHRTPLHIAAAKGDVEIVNLLLDSGANPNEKDLIGNTPLHLAACTSHIRVITMLLKAGTDVNALDQTGRTPLHLVTGRLKLLQESSKYSHSQLKIEVSNIIDMMKEYLARSKQSDGINELEDITERLQHTSTKEEIDVLGSLLSDFASLQLTKPDNTPVQSERVESVLPAAASYINPSCSDGTCRGECDQNCQEAIEEMTLLCTQMKLSTVHRYCDKIIHELTHLVVQPVEDIVHDLCTKLGHVTLKSKLPTGREHVESVMGSLRRLDIRSISETVLKVEKKLKKLSLKSAERNKALQNLSYLVLQMNISDQNSVDDCCDLLNQKLTLAEDVNSEHFKISLSKVLNDLIDNYVHL